MGNSNRTILAEPSSNGRNSGAKRCESCGAAIDTSDWYPLTKERDSDGSLQLYPFCSEACQNGWLDRQTD